MSLILVVEPDSRHAAQLASMAHAHLQAEIVMADSADRAVTALANRIPDVVLTGPLLRSRDEAALAEHLRGLGPAAAHVQTLTVPILSPAAPKPARGIRGRFRRERAQEPLSDGCDPAVFADQIKQYLRRARQARCETETQPTPTVVVLESEGEDVDLTELLNELSEPDVVPAPSPLSRLFEPAFYPLSFDAHPPIAAGPEMFPADIVVPPTFRDPGLGIRDSIESRVPNPESRMPVTLPAVVAPRARPGDAPPANIQQIFTLPAANGAQVQASVNVAVAVQVHVAATASAPPASKRRSHTPKPVQDEWGFFDPDQCGFQALIARLDTIAATEEAD